MAVWSAKRPACAPDLGLVPGLGFYQSGMQTTSSLAGSDYFIALAIMPTLLVGLTQLLLGMFRLG